MLGIGWVLLLAAASAVLCVALAVRLRHSPRLAWLWGAAGAPATPKVERTLPLGTTAPVQRQTAPLQLQPVPVPAAPWPMPDSIQVREPLAEADTGQAQGFYAEVADLLKAQLDIDPARHDLHRTLLDVLRAAGHAEEYVRQAEAYYERTSGGDAYWEGIALAGRDLAPDNALFGDAPGTGTVKKFQRFYETVSQTRLNEALRTMNTCYEDAQRDPAFARDLSKAMADGARRPTPLTPMPLAGGERAGATIFVKREDVRATNDDQLINAIGQALLAQRLGRKRMVSATRDGIHGLIVASVAARHDMSCTIYMTEVAYRRHFARVLQMRRIGAEVCTVTPAPQVDAAWQTALQSWLNDTANTFYVSSLESGPHPFPLIVRDFQSIVGQEAQIQLHAATGAGPTAVVAGVMDGYVGLGLLHAFLGEERVALYCVEPPATVEGGTGARYLREHGWLRATRRVRYVTATDEDAMQAVETLFRATGMCIPLEAARTLAYARRIAVSKERSRSVLTLIATPEERPALPPS
jgi:tryptophan synthase beta chain